MLKPCQSENVNNHGDSAAKAGRSRNLNESLTRDVSKTREVSQVSEDRTALAPGKMCRMMSLPTLGDVAISEPINGMVKWPTLNRSRRMNSSGRF